MVEHVEWSYGKILPTVVAEKTDKYSKLLATNQDKQVQKVMDKILATIFMNGAHHGFKPLLCDLARDFALGAKLHPETEADALQMKKYFGFALKQNRTKGFSEFKKAMQVPLKHLFDKHKFCECWCKRKKHLEK